MARQLLTPAPSPLRRSKRQRGGVQSGQVPPPPAVPPPAQPVVQYVQMPMFQATRGYLFPIHGNNARIITAFYDALGPHTLHGFLPTINPASVFLPVPPFTVQIQPHSILVTTSQGRFLVMYYIDDEPERPINESLAALTDKITWKGEVVVFALGATVPFRSRPSVRRAIINKVALISIAHITVAHSMGESLPRQIYTVK